MGSYVHASGAHNEKVMSWRREDGSGEQWDSAWLSKLQPTGQIQCASIINLGHGAVMVNLVSAENPTRQVLPLGNHGT